MKKILQILGIFAVILVIVVLGLFWFFYRGLNPVLGPVPANVSDLLNANLNVNAPSTSDLNANMANGVPDLMKPTVRGPFTILGDFKMDIFSQGLKTPRVLLFDDQGNLLVSAMGEGKVYAIKADGSKIVLAQGLNNPHGLAIKDGYLYIAESDKVSRYKYDIQNLKLGAKEKLFDLPGSGGHFTRTIQWGSDGFLYVSVGSSCNVCQETDERRATILKYNPKDWTYTIFAKGLRNTVFFLENPLTKQFWGNDMGRDLLGDDLPPDELNILQEGKNYGWPVCYGDKINDRDFDKNIYIRDPCQDGVAPIWSYPAHNAPLGLVFINSPMFPASWQGDLLVALHGSWNRSVPDGYKVVHLKVSGNKILSSEDFITGFLVNSGAIGRPVGLVFGKDGALYLSDDKAGVVYKIWK